jgi:hypothetical protein
MNYTLITRTGKVYTFYVKAVAETYQKAYGGTIVDKCVLNGVQQIDTMV